MVTDHLPRGCERALRSRHVGQSQRVMVWPSCMEWKDYCLLWLAHLVHDGSPQCPHRPERQACNPPRPTFCGISYLDSSPLVAACSHIEIRMIGSEHFDLPSPRRLSQIHMRHCTRIPIAFSFSNVIIPFIFCPRTLKQPVSHRVSTRIIV